MRTAAIVAVALALCAIRIDAQQADADGVRAKLTTVLADLATSSSGSTAALTTESQRPSPVRDAMQNRRLRFDANNEVQVYILMSAVTDESVAQVMAAGATIEIRDVPRRRV